MTQKLGFLLLAWLIVPYVSSQICNSRDLQSGGMFIPAFGHGSAMAKIGDTEVVTCKINASDPADSFEDGCIPAENDMQPMAIVYLILLLWSFIGVGIISDVFMCAIERITSQAKMLEYTDEKNGKVGQVEVFMWNPTVANLTLMALGSSAPEILINVIEILFKGYYAGELGPSTIVGSAAFNMFGIIAVCVSCIPAANKETREPGTRKIKELGVYSITALFSVFAYLWLFFILKVTSPNVVSIGEALITFMFFPVLVSLAFAADRGMFSCKRAKVYPVGMEKCAGEPPTCNEAGVELPEQQGKRFSIAVDEVEQLLADTSIPRDNKTAEGLAQLLKDKNALEVKVSRAAYRIDATRGLVGGKRIFQAKQDDVSNQEVPTHYLGFETTGVRVLESVGKVVLKVKRSCKGSTLSVDYKTRPGTADKDDYVSSEGTLEFEADELEKTITIAVAKDGITEAEEVFYVDLSNAQSNARAKIVIPPELDTAKVIIADTDTPGFIEFKETTLHQQPTDDDVHKMKTNNATPGSPTSSASTAESEPLTTQQTGVSTQGTAMSSTRTKKLVTKKSTVTFKDASQGICAYHVLECDGMVLVGVVRRGGSSGRVTVGYYTKDGTASAGADYEAVEDGTLVFESGEVEKTIRINIFDDDRFELDETFQVRLKDPEGCTLGSLTTAVVTIRNDDELVDLKDKIKAILKLDTDKLNIGASNWKDQFMDAVSWPHEHGAFTKTMHVLSLPFKVIFASCAPPAFCGGWLCFCWALGYIGLLTAVIADLANLLGCALGIKPNITAITFVALGTSLPDTFASKAAALADETADNSIGNVTGSNSVNVFLGLGLPWLIASVYWKFAGTNPIWEARAGADIVRDYPNGGFVVPAGDLGFSVVVFSGCAITCLGTLSLRRLKYGYELGGEMKLATACFFWCLWLCYIMLSIAKSYEWL